MKRRECLIKVLLTALLLSGCSVKEEPINGKVLFPEIPSYSSLLNAGYEKAGSQNQSVENPPVHVYISNTANMGSFVFSEDQGFQADSHLINLLRGIHDMGIIYGKTSYYTLQKEEDMEIYPRWTRYQTESESLLDICLYKDFLKPEFYLDQNESDESQPLSLLYGSADGEWDPENINLVITDMTERNMEPENLAKRIRDMCQENRCDAYLLVFQPEYYGTVKVPKPNNPEILIEKRVEGTRPCYLMITGPSYYLEKYMDSFLNCLESLQLRAGEDFQQIRFYMGQEKTEILPNQITFIEDLEDEKAYEKGNVQVSKSINSYESGEKEAEVPELRFFYKPEKNTIKAEMDWNVHFKVSLNIPAGKQLHNYGEKIQCFQLKHSAERKQGKEKKTWGQWVEAEDFEVEKNILFFSSGNENKTEYADIRLSGNSELLSAEPESLPQVLLIIVTITYTEKRPYKMPEWVERYNAVSEEDCGWKTYGLEKVFEILFGCEAEGKETKTIFLERTYGEIPILIIRQEECP